MAQQRKIIYGIDFEVQKKSLENLKTELNNIKNMSKNDFIIINPQIDTEKAKEQLSKIKTTAKIVEEALRKSFNPKINSTNITAFNAELQKSNLSLTEIYNDFSKAGPAGQRAFQSIANQATNFNKKIKQTHSLLDKIGTTLTNTIKWNISSSVINGVTQSIQQAWGFAKNLDSSLNDIRVVTGKSADEMARFAERANAVASNLGKGTTDYTRAALIYAQQGLEDKDIESRTAVTLKTANVTGQSADAVSEELTAVWNGYKVSADEAELYVDRLAAVASTTASDLQELSTGMSKVASAASAMGVGEEQLAAQLSTIISVTRQAPESVGTALRTVYARITDIKAGVEEDGTTLGQYSGKMAEMGINVLDAAGNLRDMGSVMEEIGAKWSTMTREQQVYLAQTMAGQRQYNNLLALFDNFDKYNSALETAQNAEGTLAEQNEIHMESLNAHIQQLTTATEKMWMNLTDTDGMKNVIDDLTSIIDKVDYLFKSIGGGQNLLNSIGAIAMTLMSKNIAQGLSTTITNMKMAREETAEFKNQYKNVQEILAADDAARAANATRNNDEQQQTPLDDSFRGIIEDRGRLNQVSKVMSGDDFSETMTNLGQAANLTQRKNEILQSIQEIVDASNGELESVEQFFDTTDDKIMSFSDTIIKNLKKRGETLNKQISNIQEQQQTLSSMDFDNVNDEDIKLQTDLIGLSTENAFKKLDLDNATEAEKRAIEQLKSEWADAQEKFKDTGSLEEYHKNASQILGQLKGTLKSSANDVKRASEEATNFTEEGGRKIKQQVGEIQQEIDNKTQQAKGKIEQAARTTTIQGLTQFVSGITMAQGAINNLSSAIENVKKTGDIGSLFTSFLITAPMAISSLAQIESGLLKMTHTASISAAVQKILSFDIGKTAKATWGKITATLADIKATKAKTAATATATASEIGFAESIGLTTSASVVAATAVLGVVAALALLKIGLSVANEARRQEIEYNQKIIEQEKEKQQQYNKEKDIISEVEELNKKYEQGIITRTELKNQVEELQKKYGDQSVRIQRLIKDYKNLGQVIEQVKRERNQDEAISVQREKAAAQVNAQRTMEIMHKVNNVKLFGQTIPMPSGLLGHIAGKISGQPTIQIHADTSGRQIAAVSRLSSIMGEEGNIANNNTFIMANASDYRSAKRQYDILQQYINTASEEEKKTDFYKDIADIVDSAKSSIEQAQEAQIKQIANSVEFAIINSKSDFSKVNSTSDYVQQYNQLKAEIEYEIYKKNPVATPQEINQQINQALTAAIPEELQNMYGSKQQAIERLTSNLGQPADDVKQMIDSLDSAQLDAFLHMKLENVESYDSIKQALQKISQLDFSNVEGLTEANLDAAIESYNKLQQILEAIQKGKKLSKKTIQEESELTKEEIEEWFDQDVGGNYTAKAGKTQAEVEEFLKQKSVEKYRDAYRETQKTIDNNQAFLDAQEKNTVKSSDWQNQKEVSKGRNRLISQDIIDKYKIGLSALDYRALRIQDELKKFIKQQKEAYENDDFKNIKIGEDALNDIAWYAENNQWKSIEVMLQEADQVEWHQRGSSEDYNKKTSDPSIIRNAAQRIKEDYKKDYQLANEPVIKDNNTNVLAMLDFIQKVNPNSDFANNADYKRHAEHNKITQEEFNIISAEYNKLIDQYKDANQKLIQAEEKAKEKLNKIHEGLFVIDDDVDQTLVIKLGEQFQLTAKKSELLDNALESNAEKAKDVAEEVQRYNVALSSVIKNYATWQDKLSGSTADKLSVAPQIKDAMADTLGISEITLSDTFATTIQNLEDMRLALEGDEKAYKRLQQAAYEDILIHIGLDDAELNEVKTNLSTYFNELDLENIPVGAELNEQGLDKVLAALIAKGVDTEQQLEAIFASFDVDLDVVIEDGQAKILSYTKAATHELKEQQKSAEELRKAERDRIKSQQKMTEYLRDNRDLYHQINILLKDQERIISRITKNQSEMYGTELIDNLSAESRELSKQNKLYQQKQKMAKQFAADKRAQLLQYGAVFDQNGNISNYNQLKANSINQQNALIGQENGLKQIMNNYLLNGGNTSDEQYQDWQLQQTQISNQLQAARQQQTILDELLNGYESDKQIIQEMIDKLTEAAQRQIEIKLQKFDMKVKIALDLSQAQKTWNDYKRNVLQHDDILNPNRVASANKDNVQRLADINADSTALNQVNSNIQDILDRKVEFKTQGQKKAKLEEYQKQAIEIRKRILETEDAIKQTYLDQYNIIGETFEKQKSQYEFINNQLEHDKNLIKLVYGEEDYATQNLYNDKMIQNNLQSIESMNNRIKLAESNLQQAKKSGNTAVIEAAEAEWQTAIQNRNQLEEQSIQLMKDRYITAINQISHQMEMKLTNNKGFSYLDTEWDLLKKKSNLYLDDINSAFTIKDVQYNYTQALNDTKGLKSQQQLKKVMDEQLSILKEKDKLTQYDVDRAGKVLEIEKARIALEQARNNKTQMRLKRDSQGNYSYQYVADQDKIAEAEQKLNKAENDLYNFDKENYQKNLEAAYNATKEYHEKVAALQEEWGNATTERRAQIEKELKLLEKEYSDYVISLTGETEWTKQNLMDSAMQAAIGTMDQQRAAFESMSDAEKQKWLGDMVPAINSGIGEMIGKFSKNPDSFKNIVAEATQAMDEKRQEYQSGLSDLEKAAGQNYANIKKGIDEVEASEKTLIEDNDKLLEQAKKIVDEMSKTITALNNQKNAWQNVYDKTDAAVKRVYDYIAAVDKAALHKLNNDNNGSGEGTGGGTTAAPTPGTLNVTGETLSSGSNKNPLETKIESKFMKTSIKDIYDLANYFINYDNIQDQKYLKSKGKSSEVEKRIVFKNSVNQFGQYLSNLIRNKQTKGGIDTTRFKEQLQDLKKSYDDYDSGGIGDWLAHFTTLPANFWDKISDDPFKIFSKFDTGGYTGDWDSSEGRMAILHEKELVLNKQDTINMLKMLEIVRDIQQTTLNTKITQFNNGIQNILKQGTQVEKIQSQKDSLEQSVEITATFPNVNSKKEIEEALLDLTNKATQFALKYKK